MTRPSSHSRQHREGSASNVQEAGPTPLDAKRLYTIAEAAVATGVSEKAIRGRLDRKTLKSVLHRSTWHSRQRRMIPGYALAEAGLAGTVRETEQDRQVRRLIDYLQIYPGQPFTTDQLRQEMGYGNRWQPRAPRQPAEMALHTLRALGLVEKTLEPPPTGGGRPRNVWRWIGGKRPSPRRARMQTGRRHASLD